MKNLILIILLLFITFVPKQSFASDILLIGDSLAYQLGPALKNEGKKNGVVVTTYAVGSTNTAYWANSKLVESACKKYNPKIVLISLGTNDIPIKKHSDFYYRKLVTKIKNSCSDSTIIWLFPPKMRFNLDFVRRSALGTRMLDYVIESDKIVLPREKDNVHVTCTGNVIWAKKIFDGLKKWDIITYLQK